MIRVRLFSALVVVVLLTLMLSHVRVNVGSEAAQASLKTSPNLMLQRLKPRVKTKPVVTYMVAHGIEFDAWIQGLPSGTYNVRTSDDKVLINGNKSPQKVKVTKQNDRFVLSIAAGSPVKGICWVYIDDKPNDLKPDTAAPAMFRINSNAIGGHIVAIGSVSYSSSSPVGLTDPLYIQTNETTYSVDLEIWDESIAKFRNSSGALSKSITVSQTTPPYAYSIVGQAPGDTVIVPSDFRWAMQPNEIQITP